MNALVAARAFIYHYIETSPPDVHMDHIVVIGERGERLLRQWGETQVWRSFSRAARD